MCRQAEIWGLGTWGLPRMLNSLSSPLYYLSLSFSLFSLHCTLQPIWRLINPEGLLFRWGFPLFPPTALHPSSPASLKPHIPPSASLLLLFLLLQPFPHTYTLFQFLLFCVPRGRPVPKRRTELTDVFLFISSVQITQFGQTAITFVPSVVLITLVWDILGVSKTNVDKL